MATGNWYVVVKSGDAKIRLLGRVEADGVVMFNNAGKWTPIAVGELCRDAGLDPVKVVKDQGPRECLGRLGENPGDCVIMTADAWDAGAKARHEASEAIRWAKLETVIPGLREITALDTQVRDDRDRYVHQFHEMMEDENNDGVRPPASPDETAASTLKRLLAGNHRAALYLKAVRQSEGGHWSDPTGSAASGMKCVQLLQSGAPTEEAEAALAERRDIDPWN